MATDAVLYAHYRRVRHGCSRSIPVDHLKALVGPRELLRGADLASQFLPGQNPGEMFLGTSSRQQAIDYAELNFRVRV